MVPRRRSAERDARRHRGDSRAGLLYTNRRGALDGLAEALVDSAHRRGDELLAVLAEEEPAAVCRAVDRWAHDERPARRVAALAYGLRAAPHARTETDRGLLRHAALALLARSADVTLHGGALALLVGDPWTRARYLPQALERFVAGDPQVPASALVAALDTHADPVLDAFRTRLREPGGDGEALRTLAEVTTPALARRVAELVREVVELRLELAGPVAAYVDRRLEHGPTARAALFPLVTGLLAGGPVQVRAALAAVFAEAGTAVSGVLRRELLDLLMTSERDLSVLDALPPRGRGRRTARTAPTPGCSCTGSGCSSSVRPKEPPVSTGRSSIWPGTSPVSRGWWRAGSAVRRRSGRRSSGRAPAA